MKVIPITFEEQKAEFSKSVENYASEANDIISKISKNQEGLNEVQAKLLTANTEQAIIEANLGLLRSTITALENKTIPTNELNNWVNVYKVDSISHNNQSPIGGDAFNSQSAISILISPGEVSAIKDYISRPSFDRFVWTKGDYLVVLSSIILGLSIEILNIAYKANSPIDTDGTISKWFSSKLHHHPSDNPIDYQVPGFGGELHRARSKGHDLFRFFEAIDQTAKGEFRGTRWTYGTPQEVITKLNQYGKNYPEMDWTFAFINVSIHLIADFFSAHSLPLPMSSLIYENCSRELRTFVHSLYENGFNLRHIALNSIQVFLSYLTVEIWLWFQYGTEKANSDSVILKKMEMRSSILGLLSGFNISGCLFFQNPFLINLPVLIATIDSSIKYLLQLSKQNSWVYKEIRNLDEIIEKWKKFEIENQELKLT